MDVKLDVGRTCKNPRKREGREYMGRFPVLNYVDKILVDKALSGPKMAGYRSWQAKEEI
jgi:hypothetical protein